MDSILNSVKKVCNISSSDTNFDTDLIMHINSAFMFLNQLGVGPESCFANTYKHDSWDDFLEGDESYEAVKTYVALKVKLIFDPPTIGSVLAALKETIAEYEWRLSVQK